MHSCRSSSASRQGRLDLSRRFHITFSISVGPSGLPLGGISWRRTVLRIQHGLIVLIVPLVRKRWVRHGGLRSALDPLLTTSAQFLLQQNHVSGIALVRRIDQITDEWDETDHKVDKDVQLHSHRDGRGQCGFDRAARSVHHKSEDQITEVANARNCSILDIFIKESGQTYAGTKPMTEPQPNRVPKKLPRLRSTRYALLFAFVRIFSSSGVKPGGRARFAFLVVL